MTKSSMEVVTFAVYLLGGASRSVDTEEIAIKAHEMAPSRFSWTRYPEQVNLELVRVFLSDAKKKNFGWVVGSGKTGWGLTSKGLAWAKSNAGNHDVSEMRPRRAGRSALPDERRWRREEARLRALEATRAWLIHKKRPTYAQALNVFRIDSYANEEMRQRNIARVLDLFSAEKELLGFLEQAANIVNSGERSEAD